jgi:hypothetical protein
MLQSTIALTKRPHYFVLRANIIGDANCTAKSACELSLLLEKCTLFMSGVI